MPLHIVRDDIANMRTDAVVVPANSALAIGGGAGESVARIAGIEAMQKACDAIGGCPVGSAVATPAFDFPAKAVIHAVGPVWRGGQSGEASALSSCVRAALDVATNEGAESISLPLLSTGAFGYPTGDAIDIETRAIQKFLEDNDADVYLVLYDRDSVRAGRSMFADIQEYIDDVYVDEHGFEGTAVFGDRDVRPQSFGGEVARSMPMQAQAPRPTSARAPESGRKREGFLQRHRRRREEEFEAAGAREQDAMLYEAAAPSFFEADMAIGASLPSLEERLEKLDESFAQTVLRLIDERGMTDVEVYKRANMSRQLFAKIRKDDGYRPTKKTACALAFALDLNQDDALALLSRAGFTLSHSSKFDVIVEYFLINEIHDIFQVNEALFAYDQPILG